MQYGAVALVRAVFNWHKTTSHSEAIAFNPSDSISGYAPELIVASNRTEMNIALAIFIKHRLLDRKSVV